MIVPGAPPDFGSGTRIWRRRESNPRNVTAGEPAFDAARYDALAHYITDSAGLMPPEKLAWIMFHSDFEAYRKLGRSITGATYLKGVVHPEVRQLGDGWFQRFIRAQIPWYARAGGWVLALYALRRSVA